MLKRYGLLPLTLVVLLWAGSGCSKAAKRDRFLDRANRDFKSEHYDRAEIEYLQVLGVAPLYPAAIRQLGLLYYAQGRFAQAFPYLQKAAELEPANLDVQVKLGLIELSSRKSKEARDLALRVLAKQPDREEAWYLLADSAQTSKEVQDAHPLLQKLRPAKDLAAYHVAQGSLYLRQKDLANAETEFKAALALEPKSCAAQLGFGNLCLARNDLTHAEAALKGAADLAPARSPYPLRYAEFKLQTGSPEEASKILQEVTSKAPDYLPAWVFRMQLAFAQRNYEDCADLIEKILLRDSANYEALLCRARLYLVKGDAPKALTELERLNTRFGPAPQVLYQMALAHLRNKDLSKAASSLTQALTLEPNFAEAILLLSELNLRQGDSASAIASLVQLVKQQPRLPQAHLLLATAYLSQQRLDDALAVYRHMADLFPKNAQIPLLMGIILAQQNQTAQARQAFEKSLQLAPGSLPALEQLVDLDLGEQQYAAALARVNQQIQKTPTAAEPWLLIGKIYWAQKDSTQAEAALLKAIDLNPNLSKAYLLLANLYVSSNKHQQALERLNGFAAKTNTVPVLMQIGIIQQELKHFPEARDAYEKLLTLNPNFSPAINNLAYLYSEPLNQLDKAYDMAEKARELAPYDPYTADTLGWVLYKKREYPRALGLLQEGASKLPGEPEIELHLGMTYYMLDQEQPAQRSLQQALQSDKNFPGKEEARQRLALLALDVTTTNAAVVSGLESRLRDNPDDPVLLNRLAALYERAGAADKAAQTCEQALKRNPQNPALMLRLARLYVAHLNQPQKALELLTEAHRLSPQEPTVSHLLGRLVFQEGKNFPWALSLLQESARQLNGDPEVLYDLAWAHYSLGHIAEAEATMQQALQPGGTFVQAKPASQFLTLVKANLVGNASASVLAQAQQVLATDPDFVPALVLAAANFSEIGDYAQAKAAYERILSRYPLFAPASRDLAILYAQHLDDDQKAYALATAARSALPDDPALTRTLGILLYRRADYQRAAQLLSQSAQKSQNDAEVLYYLGMAQYRLKAHPQSKIALQRALALNIPAKFADEAKRVLSELK